MTASPSPRPPVLAVDGFAWRAATPPDAPALEAMAAAGQNRVLFNLPDSEVDFAERLRGGGLRFPMLCVRDSQPFGGAALAARSTRDLNAMLVPYFASTTGARLPLATYVRHVFWMQPIHRLYLQVPVIEGAREYIELARSVGFVDEGVVRGHALIDERAVDVAALGLLRAEFEVWCLENERRLVL